MAKEIAILEEQLSVPPPGYGIGSIYVSATIVMFPILFSTAQARLHWSWGPLRNLSQFVDFLLIIKLINRMDINVHQIHVRL